MNLGHAQLKIYVQLDSDTDEFVLVCTDGRMSPAPCGPRIFRAPPHPNVQFRHATLKGAQADAEAIRKYLENLPERKISKKEMREQPA